MEATPQQPTPELVQVKKSDLDALLSQLHVYKKRDADFMSMLHASTFLVSLIRDELFGGNMPSDKLGIGDYMRIGTRAFNFSKKIEKEPGLMKMFGQSFDIVVKLGSHYINQPLLAQHINVIKSNDEQPG